MPIGSDFDFQTIPQDALRLKRFIVGWREFLTIFNRFERWPDVIEVIEKPERIPHDARIHGVYLDHLRRSYSIIVEHESYPEVPMGQEIPIVDGINSHKRIGLRVIDKASAIPCNLSKEALTEIFGFVVEQLEILAEFEEHEEWIKETEAKTEGTTDYNDVPF